MEEKARKTGLNVIDTMPWGTHLCQFYHTKQDLIDILVPYFKAGLENNEFCIWVTSESLGEKEAEEAIRKAVPDSDRYLERGQIEIFPHTEWYLKGSAFNSQRVLNSWIDKLNQALAKGYGGMRVTGDTAWLQKREWGNFIDYEAKINNVIGKYHMTVLCTYPVAKSTTSQVIDVMGNHQSALIKWASEWIVVGRSERGEEEALRLQSKIAANLGQGVVIIRASDDTITYASPRFEEIFGYDKGELIGKSVKALNAPHERSTEKVLEEILRNLNEQGVWSGKVHNIKKDGTPFWSQVAVSALKHPTYGKVRVSVLQDITKLKQAEELLQKSHEMILPITSQRHLTPLQERFIKLGFEALDEQETIELLLGLVLHQRECKRLARECVEHFQNLRGLLAASPKELEQIGLTSFSIFFIELLHKLPAEILKQKIIEQPIYESTEEVFAYLYHSMRDLKKEIFKVIYLNNLNQIIDAADLFEGTIDGTFVRPRQIIESAIKHQATRLIFAHNHPSGDPTPSKTDRQLTRDLIFIGNVTEIKVLDHIIIGNDRYFSFADAGLTKKYEDDFLNIKIQRLRQV